jgi:hypothetical protein
VVVGCVVVVVDEVVVVGCVVVVDPSGGVGVHAAASSRPAKSATT